MFSSKLNSRRVPNRNGIKTRNLLLAGLLPASTLLYAAAMSQPHAAPPGKSGAAKKAASAVASSPQAGFSHDVLPVVQKYCVACHTGPSAQAGIDLSGYKDAASVLKNGDLWDRVAQNVSSGHMPPAEMPAPTKIQRDALAGWVQTTASNAACALHDPGHVTLRRLNRAEYNNTVRDLCGVDIHPADVFPNDDTGYGFDNIGDVLSISPLLMEKYISAAEKVAHAAFENPDTFIKAAHYDPAQLAYVSQSSNGGDRALLNTTGSEAGIDFNFVKNGDYTLRVIAHQDKAGDEAAKMQFKLDGKDLGTVEVKAERRSPQPYLMRVPVTQGRHRFTVTFTNDYYNDKEPNPRRRDRNLYVNAIEVVGPLNGADARSPLQKQLGAFEPNEATRDQAARKFLSDFARRAYRRPVTKAEVDALVRYVTLAHTQGETFQKGIEYAMTAAMCSPNFLFRVETYAPTAASMPASNGGARGKARIKTIAFVNDARSDVRSSANFNSAASERSAAAANYKGPLNDFALASRLSYFLWSSMPDDELFNLAANGKLQDTNILAAQVKRMLKDPRARALGDNFAGQWLQLRNLNGVSPDTQRFPDFDDHLRQSMKTETEMFFSSIVSEDHSVLDFLDANYTFLNEAMANHYGIQGVKGDDFRRVTLTGDQRGGLLAQASLLTVTSNPTRTSPVKRGKWVMENLLGTPLPSAPPNVGNLPDDKKGPLVGTLRQRMEQHRANPSCAGCHARMDPIGFGLENYDATGGWRTRDGDASIDSSGVLPDGAKFNGPAQLKQILKGKKTQFVHCLAEKMTTYALGRGVERTDKCTVDDIVATTAKNGYKFSSLIIAIVQSDPFRKQRGDTGA